MLLIGGASGRRTALLRAALEAVGVPLRVVAWRDLAGPAPIEEQLAPAIRAGHLWCKIDSPGEDAVVSDALIARGARLSGADPAVAHPLRHGELAFQHWWFAGFADLLTRIGRHLDRLRLLNAPAEILTMCDKWACQLHLRARGLPVPALLGEARTCEALEEQLASGRHTAVFIKARYGSCAAGVIALRRHPDGRMVAYSSARMDDAGTLYNHLEISRLTHRGRIAPLVDALARQGAYVEGWIPKPRVPGDREASYDLRVVAACGRARQQVARISRSPMTNLHLGSQRAQPQWLDAAGREVLAGTVGRAAAAFPDSRSIGFDVCLQDGQAYVLEANAFGDLLPGLCAPDGATTYEDQAQLVAADEA